MFCTLHKDFTITILVPGRILKKIVFVYLAVLCYQSSYYCIWCTLTQSKHITIVNHVINLCDFPVDSIMVKFFD
jgi:hypothetical protein